MMSDESQLVIKSEIAPGGYLVETYRVADGYETRIKIGIAPAEDPPTTVSWWSSYEEAERMHWAFVDRLRALAQKFEAP